MHQLVMMGLSSKKENITACKYAENCICFKKSILNNYCPAALFSTLNIILQISIILYKKYKLKFYNFFNVALKDA